MLRAPLLAAARSKGIRRLVEAVPATRSVVRRFVAGSETADAVRVARELAADGRRITLDHLGEDTTDATQAAATVAAYEAVLTALAAEGLAEGADVSVKLSAVGQFLPSDGEDVALENARKICAAAEAVGATVTLDMEDHTTTDSTLGILRELRGEYPWVGAVLQAYLRRTEQDCRELAGPGSRVRLCKGAYAEPESVAFPEKSEVDKSYVRCLRVLMAGEGYPMVASHDPRMIEIAAALAEEHGRTDDDHEFQMLYGIRPEEQARIAASGARMRVYVPYGDEWYGYFMRRLAERPANLGFFLRGLATRS
ncbi:proline dehydrogenase [Amycolatopsis mediterranei S699]|uniref:proline dehydrogenase n=3 Tax=Amycolatopsis mediterranei TaxID=33910 RepID=A0A0H3D2F8_AMYMU|nr:proline dehydrogenase family protein [Amycolatopsis mediterranei]ADJ44457.1 proline dehydrogenase [Amycolatopsis mediterranei U32]AFO76170.1 proline dehydrogenase [Amycolatopsis mediterranei S699]AGT83299.1 proline dehydrogenase [Amycolatopsis mediterranei RB]KDO06625.1 proline dehydrogenase [Amycolatopsis mediterranei]KDU92465.1 proline dehydrogenase [Amycolatopsis mediterranei]